jgi:hypothetical protein
MGWSRVRVKGTVRGLTHQELAELLNIDWRELIAFGAETKAH